MELTTALEMEDDITMLFPHRKTGILGGTFDPIHNGHVDMALKIRKEYGLDKVLLAPNCVSPFKQENEVAPPQKRLHMAALCVYDHPLDLELCDLEVKRGGVSYTVDTLRELTGRYPDVDFHYIIGSDTLFELDGWKDIGELCRMVRFVCVRRNDMDRMQITAEAARIEKQYGTTVFLSEYSGLLISSTFIRKMVAEGEDISEYVPAAVEEYIYESGLYK